MWVEFLKLIIVFPVIIVLLIYVLKLMQKYVQPQSLHKSMRLIQQTKLSTKTTLSVVKVGSKYLVIACNDENIKLITTLSSEEAKEIESYNEMLVTQELFKKEILGEKLKNMKGWWKNKNEHKED